MFIIPTFPNDFLNHQALISLKHLLVTGLVFLVPTPYRKRTYIHVEIQNCLDFSISCKTQIATITL